LLRVFEDGLTNLDYFFGDDLRHGVVAVLAQCDQCSFIGVCKAL
jgi:hypothetical protein